MLTVKDEKFWEGIKAVRFGELPRLQDAVTVIGCAPACAAALPCHVLGMELPPGAASQCLAQPRPPSATNQRSARQNNVFAINVWDGHMYIMQAHPQALECVIY